MDFLNSQEISIVQLSGNLKSRSEWLEYGFFENISRISYEMVFNELWKNTITLKNLYIFLCSKISSEKFRDSLLSELAMIRKVWTTIRDIVALQIGLLSPQRKDYLSSKNTAMKLEELRSDAYSARYEFKKLVELLTNSFAKCYPYYGPYDEYFLKSRSSLEEKVKRYSSVYGYRKTEALQAISDSIRGTIIVGDISTLLSVVQKLYDLCQKNKFIDLEFSNNWNKVRSS